MRTSQRTAAIRCSEPPPAASSAHPPRQGDATTRSEGQPSARSRAQAAAATTATVLGKADTAADEHGEDGEDATLPAARMVAPWLP